MDKDIELLSGTNLNSVAHMCDVVHVECDLCEHNVFYSCTNKLVSALVMRRFCRDIPVRGVFIVRSVLQQNTK